MVNLDNDTTCNLWRQLRMSQIPLLRLSHNDLVVVVEITRVVVVVEVMVVIEILNHAIMKKVFLSEDQTYRNKFQVNQKRKFIKIASINEISDHIPLIRDITSILKTM